MTKQLCKNCKHLETDGMFGIFCGVGGDNTKYDCPKYEEVRVSEKILVEIEINDCFHCPFLNSSDTGEDCSILRKGIQEDEWSNIGFQFEENWRYEKCPLFHDGYLCRFCGVKVVMND